MKFKDRKVNKKAIAIGLSVGLALGISGLAIAYWTSSGSGTGSATTGTTVGVTVNQSTVVTGLYPGDAPVALTGTFSNTNSGSVKVGTVTAVIGTLPSGCVAGDFTINGTGVVNAEIPTGTNVGSWSGISVQMNDTALNQDACKTQTIPITYSVSAAS